MLRVPTACAAALLLGPAVALAAPSDAARDFAAAARARPAPDVARMIEAAGRLQEQPTDDGVEAIVQYGALVPNAELYHACRQALAAATEGKPWEELVKALKRARDPKQRVLVADALGSSQKREAVAPLGEALADREKPVRITAIRALGRLMFKECIAPLVERLGEHDIEAGGAEVEELYRSLKDLTGQALDTVEDWRKYVSSLPADYDPKTRSNTDSEVSTRTREGEGKIFGSEIRSHAFVLCLDISSSMRVIDLPPGQKWTDAQGKEHDYRDPGSTAPPDPQSRFARARHEFVEFIRSLSPRVRFTIAVFGDQPESKLWQPQLQVANEANKRRAIEFVEALKWSPATRTDLALEMAFSVPDADTVYLFSDGIPERRVAGKGEDIPQDEILQKARELNLTRKLRLNCYGFATTSSAVRNFLRRLAEENDGEYQDIR